MIDLSDLLNKRGLIDKVMEDKVQEVKSKIVLDVHRGAVEGSPVDTNEFRGHWEVNVPEKPFASGSITNTTPYGPYLLEGHSKQAPRGWLDNVVEAATKLGGN
ncbi:hypothetical protein [Sphingomonas sp. Leaf34]|uniref:hypothetical protein n=1 Tax=Sphingomonas sp. Leaf34 TaxID=1736216 RepID=UPI000A7445E3|nr:hypothetical protein [Sphingomonas sp. Leaf34]